MKNWITKLSQTKHLKIGLLVFVSAGMLSKAHAQNTTDNNHGDSDPNSFLDFNAGQTIYDFDQNIFNFDQTLHDFDEFMLYQSAPYINAGEIGYDGNPWSITGNHVRLPWGNVASVGDIADNGYGGFTATVTDLTTGMSFTGIPVIYPETPPEVTTTSPDDGFKVDHVAISYDPYIAPTTAPVFCAGAFTSNGWGAVGWTLTADNQLFVMNLGTDNCYYYFFSSGTTWKKWDGSAWVAVAGDPPSNNWTVWPAALGTGAYNAPHTLPSYGDFFIPTMVDP